MVERKKLNNKQVENNSTLTFVLNTKKKSTYVYIQAPYFRNAP